MSKKLAVLSAMILLMSSSQFLSAWQASAAQNDIQGKPLPLVVSTPATGAWHKKYPFDPKTFGLSRGHAPGNQCSRLAIFIDGISDSSWKCLKEIDQFVDESDETECYVTVFDAKGAQIGGYELDELSQRITELQKLAKEKQLNRLSIGIAANSSPKLKATVGLDETHDFSVTLLTKSDRPNRSSIVQSHIVIDSKSNDQAVAAMLKLTQQHVQKAKADK